MPAVLRQISVIVAALAGVVTLLVGQTAGIRSGQLALRSGMAVVVFWIVMNLLARGLVAVTPEAWPDAARQPKAPPQVGQRLDITLPGASPAEDDFTPLSPGDWAQGAADGEPDGQESTRRGMNAPGR